MQSPRVIKPLLAGFLRCFLATTMLLMFGATVSCAAGEALFLAFMPRFSTDVMQMRTRLLADYLSSTTGLAIEPIVFGTVEHYKQGLRSGSIAIGLQDPAIYVAASATHEAVGMVVKNKSLAQGGLIVVGLESPLQKIEDLAGRSIAHTGEDSATGYLSQILSMREHGLEPQRDYRLQSVIDGKQENVLFSIIAGDADAGFIAQPALNQIKRYIPAGQIRVLAETAALPNWALSVRRNLRESGKKAVAHAITHIPENHAILKEFEINGFVETTDVSYDPVRQAMLPVHNRPENNQQSAAGASRVQPKDQGSPAPPSAF